MDIEPYSSWQNPEFTKEFGGFLPKAIDNVSRNIVDTCSYDLVRRNLIILLLRTILENEIKGEIAELGVYKGETARLIHHYLPERFLNLFDTFEGFVKNDISKENDQIRNSESVNHFKDTSIDSVLTFIDSKNSNVRVFQGYFPDSVEKNLSIPLLLLFILMQTCMNQLGMDLNSSTQEYRREELYSYTIITLGRVAEKQWTNSFAQKKNPLSLCRINQVQR